MENFTLAFVLVIAPCFTDWCVENEGVAEAAFETFDECIDVARAINIDAMRRGGDDTHAWCEEQ